MLDVMPCLAPHQPWNWQVGNVSVAVEELDLEVEWGSLETEPHHSSSEGLHGGVIAKW
jgi:hypothetical protein